MMKVIYIMVMFMSIIAILTVTMLKLSKMSSFKWKKNSPFECGFNPNSPNRLPFSIHFFLISCLFLIFDVELILILPIMKTFKFNYSSWFIMSLMLIMMMILSIIYEWKNKLLNFKWNNN